METTLTRPKALAARAETTPGIAREEFDELIPRHQKRIYRVLLGLLRDPDAADTLTQECFLRAYRNRTRFRGESSVGTWLVRIAVNLAMDHARSRRNSFWRLLFQAPHRGTAHTAGPLAHDLADPRASPERELAARQELQAVWSTVDRLSPQQRAVFVLRFAEEMTLEEVAQAMALEVGTVKSHLSRALGAIRRQLKESKPHARTSDR